MMTLRDRLRSRDIWVEGSRAFRPFDDFLLPPEIFEARQRKDELGLAVSGCFDEWRDRMPASTRARRATRWPGRCSFTV